MNRKFVYASMLIVILLVIGMANTASAYYDPTQGRFISRDPVGLMPDEQGSISVDIRLPVRGGGANMAPAPSGRFAERDAAFSSTYIDGPNLYQCDLSNPLLYADPMGLWVKEAMCAACLCGLAGGQAAGCAWGCRGAIDYGRCVWDCLKGIKDSSVAKKSLVVCGIICALPIQDPGDNDPPGQPGCKPCEPPVGALGYRVDYVPPSRPHWPYEGDHVHLYQVIQSPYPICQCYLE